jgi:hypothetical protein
MKLCKLIIYVVVCIILSACGKNPHSRLELIKEKLPNYCIEKRNDNIIIFSEGDTLLNLVCHNGEYVSSKDGLIVLSTKEYYGDINNEVDSHTTIRGNKKKGFVSDIFLNDKYITIVYDACYNINKISKRDTISYGIEFPDDIEKDLSIVDTSYLNQKIGLVIW